MHVLLNLFFLFSVINIQYFKRPEILAKGYTWTDASWLHTRSRSQLNYVFEFFYVAAHKVRL